MADLKAWRKLCERLYAKGVDVFDGASVRETQAGPRDPKVIALALLARTLSTLEAVLILTKQGKVVEARTLARCSYENFFWAAALAKRGEEFVMEMELDDLSSRSKRARALLDWSKANPEAPDREKLEEFYNRLREKKARAIQLATAARDGGVADGYIVYREFSTDAAHPSVVSLSRYVSISDVQGETFTLHAHANVRPDEAAETLGLLAVAVLSVIVAVKETVGGVSVGEPLSVLGDELNRLRKA